MDKLIIDGLGWIGAACYLVSANKMAGKVRIKKRVTDSC